VRFREYLLEDSAKLESVFKKIAENCKQFLDMSHDCPIYRGLGRSSPAKFIRTPVNRESTDLSDELTFLMDTIIFDKFEIQNIRSKCFFGTGDEEMAAGYGYPYYIFPTNGFKFVWSPEIHDPYDQFISTILIHFAEKLKEHGFKIDADDLEEILGFSDMTSSIKYAKDPSILLRKPLEEIIEKLFLPFLINGNLDRTVNLFSQTLFELGDSLKYSNMDLDSAIKSGVEIMFVGCRGYYTVPVKANVTYTEILQEIKKYL